MRGKKQVDFYSATGDFRLIFDMNCTLSGDGAIHPVLSPASGRVFERSVIEEYIKEHGKDPVSGDSLSTSDLIAIDTQPLLPKSVKNASIPGLLMSLQSEYNALVLEGYELRHELQQTRADLSSALVRNDASLRVIARLKSERDQSRQALYEIGQPLPATKRRPVEPATSKLALDMELIGETTRQLVKQRKITNKSRKRPEYKLMKLIPGIKIFAGPYAGSFDFQKQVVVADSDTLYQLPFNEWDENIRVVEGPAPKDFEHLFWFDHRSFVVTSKAILENNAPVCDYIANARFHPSGYIIGLEKDKLVAYDKTFSKRDFGTAVTMNGFEIHPDGDIIFCKTDKSLELYSFKKNETVASIDIVAKQVTFSSNGYTVALANDDGLYLYDLRGEAPPQCVDTELRPTKISFDGEGKLLASLDEDGSLAVFEFKNKTLSLLEIPVTDISDFAWLDQRLVVVNPSEQKLRTMYLFEPSSL